MTSLLKRSVTGDAWGLKPMDYFGGDMAGMAVNGEWWGLKPPIEPTGDLYTPIAQPPAEPPKKNDPPSSQGDASLGLISLGLSVGSALSGAYAAYSQAMRIAGSLDTAASISATNAKLMQFGVDQSFRRRDAEVAMLTRKAAEIKARSRVAYAARGVALGTGTSAEVLASSDIHKAIDKAVADTNALAQAWGYRRQAIQLDAQAKAQRIMADAHRKSAPWQAGVSLLNSAAAIGTNYVRFGGGGLSVGARF